MSEFHPHSIVSNSLQTYIHLTTLQVVLRKCNQLKHTHLRIACFSQASMKTARWQMLPIDSIHCSAPQGSMVLGYMIGAPA